jgi:hypothetical protein
LLSVYVNGCKQNLHNDAENGQVAYVFSLSRWNERNFSGGETILMRAYDVESPAAARSAAGGSVYDKVAPQFNQLLVFDDRVVHGVAPVEGTMDPLRGRVVLHGHIRAGGIVVDGTLDGAHVVEVLKREQDALNALMRVSRISGLISLRLNVLPDGGQAEPTVLLRQFTRYSRGEDADALAAQLTSHLRNVRFARSSSSTHVYLPIRVSPA